MTNKTKDRILSGASKVGLTLTAWVLWFLLLVLYGRGRYRQFKWWSIRLESRIPGVREGIGSPTPESDARVKAESEALMKMLVADRLNSEGDEARDLRTREAEIYRLWEPPTE